MYFALRIRQFREESENIRFISSDGFPASFRSPCCLCASLVGSFVGPNQDAIVRIWNVNVTFFMEMYAKTRNRLQKNARVEIINFAMYFSIHHWKSVQCVSDVLAVIGGLQATLILN